MVNQWRLEGFGRFLGSRLAAGTRATRLHSSFDEHIDSDHRLSACQKIRWRILPDLLQSYFSNEASDRSGSDGQ